LVAAVKPTIVIEDSAGGRLRWTFDLVRDRLELAAAAVCYRGVDERGLPVFVKEVEHDDEARERAEREVAALRRVGAHEGVLALLGTCDATGGRSYRVFEWADVVLHEALAACHPNLRSTLADVVEEALVPALRAVHAAGLVHCDVAPNNIVRVGACWKLADFDVAVAEGEPTVGQPTLERYRSRGRAVGSPARTEYDWDGLRAVLAQVRGR
jgi:serine/threonine protein kinase